MALPERIGRYRVLELLGQGAMGTVYRGRDETLDRDVALKVMSAKRADADGRARFAREARAAARLQHPNIVTIYELGEHEGGPFMALELLEGLDLQRAIESGIKPDPRLTLPVVLQVLAGLAHAHDAGIVHRDIKPSNVFLPRDRPAKVMDFGVARLAGGTTTGGLVVGTPNYMSPEQVRAASDLDGRSDLFSVGLILYELVTGEKAYRADTLIAVLYKIANEEPDLGLIPRGPAWTRLREVLGRALAKSPGERYPDASAMADDVASSLRDLGGTPDPHDAADQVLRFRQAARPAAVKAPAPPAQSTTPAPPARATPLPEGPEGSTAARQSPPRPPEPGTALGVAPEGATTGAEAPRASRGLFLALGALAFLAFGAGLAFLPRGGAAPSQAPRPSPQPTLDAPRAPGAVPTPAESKTSAAPLPPATGASPVATPNVAPPSTLATPALDAAVPPATTTPARPPATTAAPPTSAPSAAVAPTPTAPERAARPSPPGPGERPSPSREATDEKLLERADALFERGQYAAAAAEAKTLLGRDPGNARAREILEDAEVEIVVEGALKAARQALREGDRARALAEVERGLARKPTDGRLTALLRQLRP